MDGGTEYDHYLIRDATVLARIPCGLFDAPEPGAVTFFDVRTGVQLKEIHPPLGSGDLTRGHLIPESFAMSILRAGSPLGPDPMRDASKVVPIIEIRQRKLDSVVADSVLDQVRVLRDLLQHVLDVAESAQPEERFWLSQQLLTLIGKFSGRELSELEEILQWFTQRPRK
ncbi:MAG: hypothetical protein AB1646_00935 [Thermodesulfobacteriota bacterium]